MRPTQHLGRAQRRWRALAYAVTLSACLASGLSCAAATQLFEPVAEGVYVMAGDLGEPSPDNAGAVSNLGLLVGPMGAVVIGTGASDALGEQARRAAAALAAEPLRAAINLQATPDHVLGNAAFQRHGIPVLAHEDTVLFMRANCTACLRNLAAQAGEASVAGTQAAEPDGRLHGGDVLTLIGRPLEILHFGTTFQAGSIAVLDRERQVLFAGELLSVGRIPDLRNADLDNWLAALQRIARLPVRLVVPAHGEPVPPERVGELADYLRQLRAAVQRAYAAGRSISEARREVELPAFRHWALYPGQHRRNVYFTYLRVEEQDFAR